MTGEVLKCGGGGTITGELRKCGGGGTMTGEVLKCGGGGTITGELATATPVAVNETQTRSAERSFNLFSFMGYNSWGVACTKIVPQKLHSFYNKSN
jgi:hypothetical protein